MLPTTAKKFTIFLFAVLLLPVFAAVLIPTLAGADDFPVEPEVVSPEPAKLRFDIVDPSVEMGY